MSCDKKILIVDDECLSSLALGEYLQELGYSTVGYAADGPEALRKFEAELPDIIFLDLKLRGSMDGLELGGKISQKKDVPIIIITGYSGPHVFSRQPTFVPAAVLVKPIDYNDIKNVISVIG